MNTTLNFRHALLASQVLIHALFLVGLFVLPWIVIVPSLVVSQILFVGLCGTVYYHRIMAHKVPIHRYLENFLMLLSWVGCSGSVIGWVGTHRKHHRYQDTDKDPHSPHHAGFWKTYWWSSGAEDIIRYVPDLLRNKNYVFQHKNYFTGLLVAHAVGFTLMPFWVYWAVLICPAFLMWFAGSCVNVFSHDDHGPRNHLLLGLLFAGEGWHKNHHDNASAPYFGHPLDWGYSIFKLVHHGKD